MLTLQLTAALQLSLLVTAMSTTFAVVPPSSSTNVNSDTTVTDATSMVTMTITQPAKHLNETAFVSASSNTNSGTTVTTHHEKMKTTWDPRVEASKIMAAGTPPVVSPVTCQNGLEFTGRAAALWELQCLSDPRASEAAAVVRNDMQLAWGRLTGAMTGLIFVFGLALML